MRNLKKEELKSVKGGVLLALPVIIINTVRIVKETMGKPGQEGGSDAPD